MRRFLVLGVALLLVGLSPVLLVGCDEDDEEAAGGIADDWEAGDFVRWVMGRVVYQNIVSDLAQGDHNGTVVQGGLGGTATVTGKKFYSGTQDCGSSCVWSWTENDLTIVLDDFHVMISENDEAWVTGTVTYTDDTWSRQSGLGYTSGGNVGGSGTNVSGKFEFNDGAWSMKDKATFSATTPTTGWNTISGSLTCSSGTYSLR